MDNYSNLLDKIALSFREEQIGKNVNFQIEDKSALEKLRLLYSKVKSLIIVRLDAIGDTILFSNSYKQIRELFPNANITAFVYLETKEITQRNLYIDKVIYFDRASIVENSEYLNKILNFFRNQKYDILINPLYSREPFSDELVKLINADFKIGVLGDSSNIDNEVIKVTNNNYNYLLKVNGNKIRFELFRNTEIISLLGGKTETSTIPELWLNNDDKIFVKKFINDYKIGEYAIVFPGGKGGLKSYKYWGSKNFAKLIDYLQTKLKIKVVLFAGLNEEDICIDILSYCKSNPIVLPGYFDIWKVAHFIINSKFYIGTDTSITHLSAALNKQTIVLLGGGHFGRFFPYPFSNNVHSVYKRKKCYQCNWKCTEDTNKCLKDIRVSDVISKLEIKHKSEKFNVNIIEKKGSNPKIDVLLPPGSNHSWHLKDGFVNTLRSKNLLNKVFYSNNINYSHILEYISSGGNSDFIIGLGGDHHIYYLQDTSEKRKIWDNYKNPKVCYSYESTLDSIYPFYHERAENAAKVYSHLLVADEIDVKLWTNYNKSAIWFPQFVDEKLFKSIKKIKQRKNLLYFKGKLWDEYENRKKIILPLIEKKLCPSTNEKNHKHSLFEKVSATKLIQLYNSYQFIINPPGVFGGFNVRTFEALACGNILLQFEHKNRAQNNSLFKNKEHLIYFNIDNVDRTIKDIEYYVKHSSDLFNIAEAGKEEVIKHHTVEKRIDSILNWLDKGKIPQYPNYSQSNTTETPTKGFNKIGKREKIGNVSTNTNKPKVSAIVSSYNSEKFICGCLDDLISQSIYDKDDLEIVVVVSGSKENEKEIIEQYQTKHKSIKIIVSKKRETIYQAWNRGIKTARGKYITNANTDDRHRYDAFEIMANELDNKKEIALVYADSKVTQNENETFENANIFGFLLLPEYDRNKLFEICYLGPHPMWRKSLHKKYGYFDGKYKSAGDYEFWLRLSSKEKFSHINKLLGLYLLSSNSVENSDRTTSFNESELARSKYWKGNKNRPTGNNAILSLYKKTTCVINSPLFSVLLFIDNNLDWVKKILDNLVSQTCQNFEIIIANNGVDDISNVVDMYEGKLSVKYLHQIVNTDFNESTKNLVKISKGKYLAFINNEIINNPNYLENINKNIDELHQVFYTDIDNTDIQNQNELCGIIILKSFWYKSDLFEKYPKGLGTKQFLSSISKVGLIKNIKLIKIGNKMENLLEQTITTEVNKFIESFQQAEKNIKDKDFNSASKNLQIALDNYENSDGIENLVEYPVLLDLAGNISIYNNDIPLAKSYFEEELNNNPTSSTACAGLGQTFLLDENFTAAKTMYEWAVKNDPSNKNAISGLQKTNIQLNLSADDNSLEVEAVVIEENYNDSKLTLTQTENNIVEQNVVDNNGSEYLREALDSLFTKSAVENKTEFGVSNAQSNILELENNNVNLFDEKGVNRFVNFLKHIKHQTYSEAPSKLHTTISDKMISVLLENYDISQNGKILDIGCGQGLALEKFSELGYDATGITLNDADFSVCKSKGFNVFQMDQSFLKFDDNEFSLIWARHVLEHSILPYYTLHEYKRVLKDNAYLYIEVPACGFASQHEKNPNHYSVLNKELWKSLFERTGFKILFEESLDLQLDIGQDRYLMFILQND